MKFPVVFIKWITACVQGAQYSVKINGVIHGFFPGKQGLRQGCPLSPYLFTIVTNILSCLLAATPSQFKFHWKCRGMRLSHLLFADDLLLFSHGDSASITHIMHCLQQFSTWSGLQLNLDKSTCFFSNCDSSVVSWFESEYGIPGGTLPVRFLGVPLITKQLSINDCVPLIDKITGRLLHWTNLLLSFAGRTQLITSILLAIQAFWSNHFILPKAVHKHIQQILTRFLWKGDITKKGGAKVAWYKLCSPKAEGGLGVKDPIEWNKAQILTHLWKVVSNHTSLWATWIRNCILKNKSFWCIKIPTDTSWIWKKVLQLCPLAAQFINFDIGSGEDISLWFDPWYNHKTLADSPTSNIIYSSGLPPESTVNDLIRQGSWILPIPHLHHVDEFHDWAAGFSFPEFNLAKSDAILWDSSRGTKVRTSIIWNSIRRHYPVVPWHEAVWCKINVPRFAFNNWIICLGRLPTFDRLINEWNIDCNPLCIMCPGSLESTNHLLLHCSYGNVVLKTILRDMRILDFPVSSWVDFLQHLMGNTCFITKTVSLLSAQVYAYHLWRERNSRIHGKGLVDPFKLLRGIREDIRSRLHSSAWFRKYRARNHDYLGWFCH